MDWIVEKVVVSETSKHIQFSVGFAHLPYGVGVKILM